MSELADTTTRGRSAADHLTAEIRGMSHGDRLGTKKDLCARLGIALATLNEALRLLQERGLITLQPGPKGGIFVARTDPSSDIASTVLPSADRTDLVAGAIEVSASLQELAALDVLRHRTEADLDALRSRVGRLTDTVDDASFNAEVQAFHTAIAELSANEFLRSVHRGVLAYVDSSAPRIGKDPRTSAEQRQLVRHIEALVEAIAARDEAACRRAMQQIAASDHWLSP